MSTNTEWYKVLPKITREAINHQSDVDHNEAVDYALKLNEQIKNPTSELSINLRQAATKGQNSYTYTNVDKDVLMRLGFRVTSILSQNFHGVLKFDTIKDSTDNSKGALVITWSN